MTDDRDARPRGATAKNVRRVVANNVRVLAHRRGWSLAQLVDFAQVTRSALFRALRGDAAMTIDTLAKLAGALGVEPALLLSVDAPELPELPSASVPTRGRPRRG